MSNIGLYANNDFLCPQGSAGRLIRFSVGGSVIHVGYYPDSAEKVRIFSVAPATVIDEEG